MIFSSSTDLQEKRALVFLNDVMLQIISANVDALAFITTTTDFSSFLHASAWGPLLLFRWEVIMVGFVL